MELTGIRKHEFENKDRLQIELIEQLTGSKLIQLESNSLADSTDHIAIFTTNEISQATDVPTDEALSINSTQIPDIEFKQLSDPNTDIVDETINTTTINQIPDSKYQIIKKIEDLLEKIDFKKFFESIDHKEFYSKFEEIMSSGETTVSSTPIDLVTEQSHSIDTSSTTVESVYQEEG